MTYLDRSAQASSKKCTCKTTFQYCSRLHLFIFILYGIFCGQGFLFITASTALAELRQTPRSNISTSSRTRPSQASRSTSPTRPTQNAPSTETPSLPVLPRAPVQQLPDLTVRNITFNTRSPKIGSILNVTATIYNLGKNNVTRATVRFTYQGKHQDMALSAISTGKSRNITTKIHLKGSPGTQNIKIHINPAKTFKESNYANNSQVKRFQVLAEEKPDIISVQPASLQQGTTTTVKFRARNINRSTRLDFGRCISQIGTPLIGETVRVKLQVSPNCPPASYPITIKMNRETYKATAKIRITPLSLPDLTIRNLTIDGQIPKIGSTVKVKATIFNNGKKRLTKIPIQFTYQGNHQKMVLAAIGAGKSGEITANITIEGPPGSQKIKAHINPAKSITENQYSNNSLEKSFKALPGGKPAIISIQPHSLQRGKTTTVKLQTKNLDRTAQLDFGKCISQTGNPFIGNTMQIKLQVSKNCPTGNYPVTIKMNREKYRTSSKISVISAILPVLPKIEKTPASELLTVTPPPRITQLWSINPNRWQRGKDYSAIVKGKDFKPEHWLSLRAGIDVKTTYRDSSTLKLQVAVKGDAEIGHIPIHLCTGPKMISSFNSDSPQCDKTSLYGWVVPSQTPPPVTQIECDDLNEETSEELQKIELEKPISGFGYNSSGLYTWHIDKYGNASRTRNPEGTAYYYDRGVSLLDDQTVFQWQEITKGLADFFEIQFLSLEEKIIKTVTITTNGNITTFKPDPQLIMDLYTLAFAPQFTSINSYSVSALKNSSAKAISSNASGGLSEAAGAASNCASSLFSMYADYMTAEEKLACYKKKYPGVIKLLWRVNGYKKVNICAVSPTGSTILSKETVQVETSDFGYLRLGYQPTGTPCEKANGKLTATKKLDEEQETDDHSWYPGDTIELDGSFTLNNCPWHVDGKKTWIPLANMSGTSYVFNNVFVDWGDGKVKRLAAAGNSGTDDNSEIPDFQSDIKLSFHANHIYKMPGQYQARIFVLATDDIDSIDAIEAVEDRMFLVYCNPIDITIVQDIAATGSLHLKAINIVSLSSENNLPSSGERGFPSAKSPEGKSQSVAGKIALQETLSITYEQQPLPTFANNVSTCDAGLWARVKLDYYGQGYIRLEWRVAGVLIKSEERKVGPSELRDNLSQNPADWDSNPIISNVFYTSPALPVSTAGAYKVIVNATVINDPTGSTVNSAATQFQNITVVSNNSYSTLQQELNAAKISMVDSHVTSPPKMYTSKQNDDPTCNFLFTVNSFGGYFLVTNTKDILKQGDLYSGTGTLIYRLPDTAHSVKEFFQPLNFSNWEATSTSDLPVGLIVDQGHLATTGNEKMDDLPGMSVQVRQLAGEAGDQVNAVFDVAVKDTTLRLAGSEVPQSWSGLSATLTPAGDWYLENQTLGLTRIGWSLFNIESNDVRIDLSHRQGSSLSDAKGLINGNDTDWVGIHLGSATLYPYTFKLDNTVSIDIQNWGIMEGGLYGSSYGTGFDHVFGDGRLGWDSIDITVEASDLDAQYAGMFVEMAWPKVRLEGGNTHLSYAPGENASVSVDFSTTEVPHEEYGAVSMTSKIKNFEFRDNWGINTDTTFEFFERGKPINQVVVDDIFFTIFSIAEFAGNQKSKTLSISGETLIGGADTTLSQIIVNTKDKKGALDFTLKGKLNLEKIQEFNVDIGYRTEKDGDQILAAGPIIEDLPPVEFQFPDGSPVMKSTIKNIQYRAGTSNRSGGSGGGCSDNDAFTGTMPTELFGAADKYDLQFRFGEKDNNPYWLAYGVYDDKIAVYPPYLYITAFKGGMAYNFKADALLNGNQNSACPSDGGLVFSAGVDLSVLEDGVVTGDAILTVAHEQGEYRFDTTKVVVLGIDLKQKSEYVYNASNDSFHGTIWGDFEPLDGVLRILTEKHSVSFGVSGDDWHLSMGRENGPTAGIFLLSNPIGDGYLLEGRGYFEFGSKIAGFTAGINTGFGIATKVPCVKKNAPCASVNGDLNIDFIGSYNPWSFSLDTTSNMGLGGCVDFKIWSGCTSVGSDINLGIGINPNRFGVATDISPVSCVSVDIGLEISPDLYPWFDASWTCKKFW